MPLPVPIMGVTGINGAGKTLYAVDLAINAMIAGFEVYSTVPIFYTDRKGNVYESRPLLSLTQLLELRDCVVLLDEVASIFSSKTSSSIPGEVITYLKALRHRDVAVLWTSPNWADADVQLRRITQAVATFHPVIRRRVKGRLHPRTLLTMCGILDTAGVGTDKAPERVLKRFFRIPHRMKSFGAYDTRADTPQIGRLLQSGPCPDCGGTRASVKCSPEVHETLGLPASRDRVAILAELRAQAEESVGGDVDGRASLAGGDGPWTSRTGDGARLSTEQGPDGVCSEQD